MKLVFTKRSGKTDDLVITRDDRTTEQIACPKQGMIPHEMVHFAIETVIRRPAFLSKIGEGQAAGAGMISDAVAESAERMVETMQAEVWSGRVPVDELISLYETACQVRGHTAAPLTPRDVGLIRARMDDLAQRWDAVPVGGSMALEFDEATAG